MEVRVLINGVEAVIDVANATEAAELLAVLSKQQNASLNTSTNPPQSQSPVTGSQESSSRATAVSSETLRKALRTMKGKPAAKVLLVIVAKGASGCTDTELRNHPDIERDINLGPVFSYISKVCSRFDIGKENIFHRFTKRGPKGKMFYKYQITDEAAQIIKDIEEFDQPGGEEEYVPEF